MGALALRLTVALSIVVALYLAGFTGHHSGSSEPIESAVAHLDDVQVISPLAKCPGHSSSGVEIDSPFHCGGSVFLGPPTDYASRLKARHGPVDTICSVACATIHVPDPPPPRA